MYSTVYLRVIIISLFIFNITAANIRQPHGVEPRPTGIALDFLGTIVGVEDHLMLGEHIGKVISGEVIRPAHFIKANNRVLSMPLLISHFQNY